MKQKELSAFFKLKGKIWFVFLAFLFGSAIFYHGALAATPVLTLSSNNDGDTVQVTVNGDPNSSVIFNYSKTNVGSQVISIGNTNSSGYFSTSISTSGYSIASGSAVYVVTGGLNGHQSNSVAWPITSTSGNFYLSQTGISLSSGQSTTLTAYNFGSGSLYLSNNSNPSVANININGGQVTVTAINYGSTVASICMNSSTCASVYITVQNGSTQTLTFSMNSVTVSPGQSVPITITNGTGNYTVLNNSNSSVIQTGLSGSIVTLTTNSTSGTAAITVCSTDMSSCGIINATASTASSSPISFSQTSPAISVGQSLVITLSGGSSSTYYVSANSNSTILTPTISGGNLTLVGNSLGSSIITVCSSSGSCGSITATVGYTSSGGAFQLSQTSISLLTGQVLSITASGGTTPYILGSNSGSVFQASLNGNIITISGISAGAGTLNICTSGGACLSLSVTVSASGSSSTVGFSQNNLALSAGSVTAVTITGNGGYYVSSSSNSNVASVQINGTIAIVSALTAGNANVSICQSGGQCSILFINVTPGSAAINLPTFNQVNPVVNVGQAVTETISGGSSSSYYISANTNSSALSLSLNNNQLTLTGLSSGSSIVVICAASNSCGTLTVTINSASSSSLLFTITSVPAGVAGQSYSYQILATGGSGSLTYAVSSGGLPTGLALSGSGLVSGTPSASGTNSFSVTANDSSGHSAVQNFTLQVSAASSITMPTTTTPSDTTIPVTSPSGNTGAYTSGQLISENGTVYIVYQNTKVGFANAKSFLGLGFSFKNVTTVSNSGLTPSTRVVITSSGLHPRGTWVLSGKAIFFVTPSGLIPVPDWATFLSNGGQSSFIVPANHYDLAWPRLPMMVLNDSRVR